VRHAAPMETWPRSHGDRKTAACITPRVLEPSRPSTRAAACRTRPVRPVSGSHWCPPSRRPAQAAQPPRRCSCAGSAVRQRNGYVAGYVTGRRRSGYVARDTCTSGGMADTLWNLFQHGCPDQRSTQRRSLGGTEPLFDGYGRGTRRRWTGPLVYDIRGRRPGTPSRRLDGTMQHVRPCSATGTFMEASD
jgi:hypothetical protein